MALTQREKMEIRDYMNEFSDRWPEDYHLLWTKIGMKDVSSFQVAVLWKLIKWAGYDQEKKRELGMLIMKIEASIMMTKEQLRGYEVPDNDRPASYNYRKRSKERYKVQIEEIDCNNKL